ncbi:hypothetical protein Tco_0199645 [Tanacetum coccineum]
MASATSNPCQGDSLNLPDHRYSIYTVKQSYGTEDSLPHAHAQTTKTYYKHQDSRIKKAQEFKTKTSHKTLMKQDSSFTDNQVHQVNMDDPNITMEEYVRLEEEKAHSRGKVFDWKTAKYGKIWYDEDVHDLRSIETEFPAIAFNDQVSSEKTISYEPTVSSLNDEIDFRISFEKSNDEDYTVIFDKNSFSYKIISTNDLKTDLDNDNDKVNMPSFPSPEPTVSYFDDLDFFKDFENEFPAIVYNDALTSKLDFLTEPTDCETMIWYILKRTCVELIRPHFSEALVNTLFAQELILENYHEKNIREFSCLRPAGEVTTASTKLLLLEEVTTASGTSPPPQKTQKPRKPKRKDTQVPQPSGPTDIVADEAVHKELGDRLVRAATTASSLEAEQDSGNITKTRSKETPNVSSSLGTTSGGGPWCQETTGDTIAQTRFENVLDLEKTKTTQHNEIASLKRRVKKLEVKKL